MAKHIYECVFFFYIFRRKYKSASSKAHILKENIEINAMFPDSKTGVNNMK